MQGESGSLDPGAVVQLGVPVSAEGSFLSRAITCGPRLRTGRGRWGGRGGNGGRVAVMWAHESAPRIASYILWMNVIGPIFWGGSGDRSWLGSRPGPRLLPFLSPATGGSRSECVPLLLSGSRGSWVRFYVPILSQVVNPLGLSAGLRRRRCGGGIVVFPLCGFGPEVTRQVFLLPDTDKRMAN